MNGWHNGETSGLEMTSSSPATAVRDEDGPDTTEDHETLPITIGYGALNDGGRFVFSWARLYMFAGASWFLPVACSRQVQQTHIIVDAAIRPSREYLS